MKNTLFTREIADSAPEEQAKPRKVRSRRAKETPAEEPREPQVFTPPAAAVMPLGRIDEGIECADSSCRGTMHDIMHEGLHDLVGLGFSEPAWVVECILCGTGQWTKVVPGVLRPKQEEFTFRDGRYAGMTISEALTQPRGPDYLAWAAKSHPREAVRRAVKTHMDALATAR